MNVASPAVRARAFDAWAEEYERYRPGYPAALFDLIAERLGLASDAAVVDLGSGTGKVARAAAGRGWRVTAVDPGAPMLAVLRQRAAAEGRGVEVVQASAEKTGLETHRFDAALAGEAYHWFDAPAALAEMARIVRPRGGVAFFWNEVDDERSALVAAERKLVQEYDIDGSEVRTGPLPETREAFRAAGGYDEPEFHRVPHVVPMTGSDYVGLAFTKSHLRTSPPELQDRYRVAFQEMLAGQGVALDERIEVPYMIECWIARRKDR